MYIIIYRYICIIYIHIIHIYIYVYIQSICRQQLVCSLRAHQYSSDQIQILKDQIAQTTARIVSIEYCIYIYIYIYIYELCTNKSFITSQILDIMYA